MTIDSEHALVARICHDLITPLNAINLGLDAYEMSNDVSLLSCIKESVEKANLILSFMRELYSSKDNEFYYSFDLLNNLIVNFSKLYNIDISFQTSIKDISYISGRIILYNTIMLKEVMPFGGKANFELNGNLNIKINYSGKDISCLDATLPATLNHRNILRYCLLKFLENVHFKLISELNDGIGFIYEHPNL